MPFEFEWSVLQRAWGLPPCLVQFSVRENLLIVTGNPESKQLKDMLPDIIKQVGPQQYEALKNLMGDFGKKAGAKTEDDDELELDEGLEVEESEEELEEVEVDA